MIKKIIIIFILSLSPTLASAAGRVFLLQILENEDKVELKEVSIVQSFVDDEQRSLVKDDDFYYNILNKENVVISTGAFSFFVKQNDAQVVAPKNKKVAKINEIEIPFYDSAAKVEVYKKDKTKIGEKSVAEYINSCGDGACQSFENYSICQKDCEPNGNDGYCFKEKNGVCDPDCLGLGGELADADCPLDRNDYVPIEKNDTKIVNDQAQPQPQSAQSVDLGKQLKQASSTRIEDNKIVKKNEENILIPIILFGSGLIILTVGLLFYKKKNKIWQQK